MATIARVPLRDEVYRQVLQRIHHGDLAPGTPSSGHRPRRRARRQPNAGQGSPPPAEPGRGAGQHGWARIQGPPPGPGGVREVGAILGAPRVARAPARPAPTADRLARLQAIDRTLEQTRGDPAKEHPMRVVSALNEIYAGSCEGMTYEMISVLMPEEFTARYSFTAQFLFFLFLLFLPFFFFLFFLSSSSSSSSHSLLVLSSPLSSLSRLFLLLLSHHFSQPTRQTPLSLSRRRRILFGSHSTPPTGHHRPRIGRGSLCSYGNLSFLPFLLHHLLFPLPSPPPHISSPPPRTRLASSSHLLIISSSPLLTSSLL